MKAFGREDTEGAKVHTVTEKAYRFSMTRVRLLARYDVVAQARAVHHPGGGARPRRAPHRVRAASSLGTFLLAFQICTALAMISANFDEFASAWQYLRGAQDRIAEMLALGSRPVTDGRIPPAPSSGLELRGVSVDLGMRRVLDDFGVSVPPGAIVVVNGPPGSGKSTIAAVASGLLIPNRGTAFLDGLELEEADPAELRRSIRVVAEEPMLFATSLRENLRMGAPEDVDDDMILKALRTAGVDEVVDELDGGLDGYVGDRGLTLSGGQRQRVALSRALVARPRVLILDDALSAVNPSLEHEIVARIHEELPETSILFITRRAGPVQLADQVVAAAVRRRRCSTSTRRPASTFATLAEAATVGGGVDEINAVMAVEELGELVEASEGIEPGTPGSSTALPASDARAGPSGGVAEAHDRERSTCRTATFGGTEPPYFWKVMRPFKWIGAVGDLRGVPRHPRAARARPDLRAGDRRRERQVAATPPRPISSRSAVFLDRLRGRRGVVHVPHPRQQVHPEPRRVPPTPRVLPARRARRRLLRPRASRAGRRPLRLRPRPDPPVPPVDRVPAPELGVGLRRRHARDRRRSRRPRSR